MSVVSALCGFCVNPAVPSVCRMNRLGKPGTAESRAARRALHRARLAKFGSPNSTRTYTLRLTALYESNVENILEIAPPGPHRFEWANSINLHSERN